MALISVLPAKAQLTQIFKPGAAAGNDTYVRFISNCSAGSTEANLVNSNFGNDNNMRVMTWTYNSVPNCGPSGSTGTTRSFLRFDQLSSLPAGAVVTNATLRLFGVNSTDVPGNTGNTASNSIQIGRVQSAWSETGMTWNNQPGVDYSNNIVVPASTVNLDNISVNVTAIVLSQISSGVNNGFGIRLAGESTFRSRWWATSDFSDATRHPELVITYTIPCQANFTYSNSSSNPSQFIFTPNTSTIGAVYEWDFGNGSSITTTGPASIPVNYAPGNYTVCLTYGLPAERGCKICTGLCVPQPLSIVNSQPNLDINSEQLNSFEIENLFPNPSAGIITLEVNNSSLDGSTSELCAIRVYDLNGTEVFSKQESIARGKNIYSMDVTFLAAGMYICVLVKGTEEITRKPFILN